MASEPLIPNEENVDIKAIIDGITFKNEIEQGYVLKDTLTDELDSFTISLNAIDKHLFEPYSTAKITTPEELTYYYYVITQSESICTIGDEKYNYTLELISQTKILERCILPNLKVRKSLNSASYKIGYYIKNIVYPYIKKQYPFITLSNDIANIEEIMPEIQWQHPTAKQVLNDLLSLLTNNPSLVKVVNNKIVILPLSKKGNDVMYIKNYMINKESYETMSDFANNIVMDVQNATPIYSNCSIYGISPRTENSARLTTDNCQLILPNARIDKVQKIIVYCKVTDTSNTSHDVSLNITKYTLPKDVYMTLPTSSTSSSSNYKEGNIYFEQGSNKIEGLSTNQKFLLINTPAINNVIKNACAEQYTNFTFRSLNTDIRNLIFDIEYYSIENTRIVVKKDEQEKIDVSLYQSQNQSNIEMISLMKTQRDAVNRLGNELKPITALLPYDKIPKLLDYIDTDYYLAQREIAYYQDFVIFKGLFSKNYIKRNIYYGIKSRKHYVNLAQTNEAVVREDFHTITTEIKTTPPSSVTIDSTLKKYTKQLVSFYNENAESKPIKLMGIITNQSSKIALLPSVIMGDKSITITTQTYDNYSVGMKVDSDNIQDFVTYTDGNGKILFYTLYFYNDVKTDNITDAKNYPSIDFSGLSELFSTPIIDYVKDNSETLKITYQFNFVSKDDNIIIGSAFGWNNGLSKQGYFGSTRVKLMRSKTKYIDKNFPIIDNDNYESIPLGLVLNEDDNSVEFGFDKTGYLSYALVTNDANNELIIGVNRDIDTNTLTDYIYFETKGE